MFIVFWFSYSEALLLLLLFLIEIQWNTKTLLPQNPPLWGSHFYINSYCIYHSATSGFHSTVCFWIYTCQDIHRLRSSLCYSTVLHHINVPYFIYPSLYYWTFSIYYKPYFLFSHLWIRGRRRKCYYHFTRKKNK